LRGNRQRPIEARRDGVLNGLDGLVVETGVDQGDDVGFRVRADRGHQRREQVLAANRKRHP